MLTRSKTSILQTLTSIKSNVVQMNTYMNLVTVYYRNDYSSNNSSNGSIVKLCLNDEQLNKIRNKRIIIYNNNDYAYAELLGYEKIPYDENTLLKYNKNNEKIIYSIDNNILDDVTIDLLIDDTDIEASKILHNIK